MYTLHHPLLTTQGESRYAQQLLCMVVPAEQAGGQMKLICHALVRHMPALWIGPTQPPRRGANHGNQQGDN